MKNYIVLSLIVLLVILGGSFLNYGLYAQEGFKNLPDTSEHPDPNKVIKKGQSGQIIPEKIEPPLDECANEKSNGKLKDNKFSKKNCLRKNGETKPEDSNGLIPTP